MLEGRKVILRVLEEADAEILQKWYMDKDFRLAYDAYESVELDIIKEEISQAKGGVYDPRLKKLPFMVLRKRDRQPIGVCCLRDIDRLNGHAELLLGIGEKDMRLSGYGLDLLIVLLDLAYYDLGLRKTYMRVLENQPYGLQNALKFGYKPEGHLRDQAFVEGKYVNMFFLGLLRSEYEKLSIVPKWKKRAEGGRR
ncbi:MAG: GNAT family N-acetyltransferase [Peptococcaceae bacterium]|jgi:RimJ/RimL family protein N-acetyltransferase|nr:GNAT family N-acetyltransferase [Peptococcaceae bacterium]